MARSRGGGVKAEPNLTPILDMVFQLITFFMMVINFKAEEVDRKLKLPVIGSAKPLQDPKSHRITVLNVTTYEETTADGQRVKRPAIKWFKKLVPKEEIEGLIMNEMMGALMKAKMSEEQIKGGGEELPDLVVIRADEECPFKALDYVIEKCQKHGFRKFAFKAFRTEKDQEKGVERGSG
jgi:biopolymer transport protein ExbD